MTPHPGLPPVPRDQDRATLSEMMPFRSGKIRLTRSPVFLLFLLTALVTPSLFIIGAVLGKVEDAATLRQLFAWETQLVIFFLLAVLLVALYVYARPQRSIWTYACAYLGVVAIFMSHATVLYFLVFRVLLPGRIPSEDAPFLPTFVGMFFAAGLCEELIKATPILLGAAVTYAHRTRAPNPIARLVQVRGPLDGVLMGFFAGAAFIFLETGYEYVPNLLDETLLKTSNADAAMSGALLLLLPRVITGAVGHMGYAAIFGYCIGLGVVRPRSFWPLIAIGWLSSALLHALWNSVAHITPLLWYAVTFVCAVLASAVLLKARQLEAAVFGVPHDGGGSILVQPAVVPAMPVPSMPVVPPTWTPPAAAAASPVAPPAALAVRIDGIAFPLRAGGEFDLEREPALDTRAAGIRAAVVAHPVKPDVLGLRNTGAAGWTATLRDGREQPISPGQNVRLAAGVRIVFASGLDGLVVVQG